VSQSSYYSANDPRLHFGLGSSTSVDLDVYWPNGLQESFKNVAANQLVTLREGVGTVPNRGWSRS
jgi:enediyne biosynthesis protein E4